MRVYRPESRGDPAFTTITAEVINNKIALPKQEIPQDATLALIGWDQKTKWVKKVFLGFQLLGAVLLRNKAEKTYILTGPYEFWVLM